MNASQNVLENLRKFRAAASKNNRTCNIDLTKTALSLLNTLPAAQDAVLEYFGVVFDSAIKQHCGSLHKDQLLNAPPGLSEQDEEMIGEIHTVLISFVTSNPHAWAPIISSWSLELLGRLSSRYGPSTSAGLNETLHWWMTCKAARILIDITTQCFRHLIDSDAEACVKSLIDTSVAHSPYFDWVVALVGACYSKTVVTRVLSLGVKDFVNKHNEGKSNKIKSVVGILGHLGTGNFIDIRTSLLELFMWSLESTNGDDPDGSLKQGVIPFLILLASDSQIILNALCEDGLNKLDLEILEKLAVISENWHLYLDKVSELNDIAVRLILRCSRGAHKILSLLLKGFDSNCSRVANTSELLIELLVESIGSELQPEERPPIPFLGSFKEDLHQILPLFMTENPKRQAILCRFFKLIEKSNPSAIGKAATYILERASQPRHLSAFMLLITPYPGGLSTILETSLGQALLSGQSSLWKNLILLLREEKLPNGPFRYGVVGSAVAYNLEPICSFVTSCEGNQSHLAMELLSLLHCSYFTRISLQQCFRLTTACVQYFFNCIKEADDTRKIIRCRHMCRVLEGVCAASIPTRAAALRELIESALFLSPAVLFGSSRRPIKRLVESPYSLAQENYKLRVKSGLTGRHSTAFFKSVFTSSDTPPSLNEIDVEENIVLLMRVLKCCFVNESMVNPEDREYRAMDPGIQIALLLVSMISPDVMYNGLPWPDEDFYKVTIERDMQIRKVFDELPLAWRLMEMLALQQPALCYCSVLMRALMATVISQWCSPAMASRPAVLDTTIRLLRLMNLGQLLPPPLNKLHEVVPFVTPQEVVSLLRSCVWNYMRDNIPSPALFSADPRSGFMWRNVSMKPPPVYTETLRLVLFSNIERFGELYRELFFSVE